MMESYLNKYFSPAIINWSFGITVLIGLVSSGFSNAETICGIFVAATASTISSLCSCSSQQIDLTKRRNTNLINFLILWLEILGNLVAAATCARLASATVDYISKGHFREFLFGLEQHSLGEPWPDVLGVTIILVVTILFMLGLEQSSTITLLLFIILVCNFLFFTIVGSFNTMNNLPKWFKNFKISSIKAILNASAICYFGFAQRILHHSTSKRNFIQIFLTVFLTVLFYLILSVVFSLMTDYRSLKDSAIPLIQVFENRDVDWARPVIAIFTICIVCLLLTEILPLVYFVFVHLASMEWKIFVNSIQYESPVTGAPVLAIFATGSLTAILAFACPLSHLIKLLNVLTLIRCILTSLNLMYQRYRADILYITPNTSSIQYRKLNHQNNSNNTNKNEHGNFELNLFGKFKRFFQKTPQYIHKLSSPKSKIRRKIACPHKYEEHECLLFENKSANNVNNDEEEEEEDHDNDNEENEMEILSPGIDDDGENSGSSTDIDVIVEEYKEGLKVATLGGKFTPSTRSPSTKLTSLISSICLTLVVFSSITMFSYPENQWINILVIFLSTVLISILPENAMEKSKPSLLLPSILIPIMNILSISIQIIMTTTIIDNVWQGIIFWIIAGLLLYSRCECCQCEILEPYLVQDEKNGSNLKIEPHHHHHHLVTYEIKENSENDGIIITSRR